MVYQGSKSRVAKEICPIIQKAIDESNCDTFVDAFVWRREPNSTY